MSFHTYCFFRFGAEEHLDDVVEDMVVLKLWSLGNVSREDTFKRFTKVLEDWTSNTQAGQAAMEASRFTFNIGDYLLVERNYELRAALEQAHVKAEIIYRLTDGQAEEYDRILAGPEAGEIPDEEN